MSRTSGNRRYLATHLGDVLETQGRKQRWLAERVGVSGAYISLVIAGERTVDREMGERIAELLNVPLFLLFALGKQSNTFSRSDSHASGTIEPSASERLR